MVYVYETQSAVRVHWPQHLAEIRQGDLVDLHDDGTTTYPVDNRFEHSRSASSSAKRPRLMSGKEIFAELTWNRKGQISVSCDEPEQDAFVKMGLSFDNVTSVDGLALVEEVEDRRGGFRGAGNS